MMTKRALSAVAGFFSLCLSLSAQQQWQSPDFFSVLNSSDLHLPSLTLSDAQPFSFSEAIVSPLLLTWLEAATPAEVALPAIIVKQPRRVAAVSAMPVEDPSKETVELRRPYFDYAGGEVGAFYGRSSGKFASEVEAGYIFGEVGNDHLQISAGASYEHSTQHFPRSGR